MSSDDWDDFDEENESMDGGDFDDDMFADFDEGGISGEVNDSDRTPSGLAFQSFTSGVSQAFEEPSTINRFVDAALPEKLREVKSQFEEGFDGAVDGYDKLEEGNKSILGMNATAVGGFLGLKGVKEYGDDLQEEARDDIQDASDEANINNNLLNSIFQAQAEGSREEAIAGQAQQAAAGHAADKRHVGSMGAMGAVLAQLKNIHKFSTDVTFKYQRANLETNLKSYDALRNMVTLTKDFGEGSIVALQALVKNTSLPEHNKVTLGEMGTQSFASHGIEGFTGALTDRGSFGERMGKKGHDFFTEVVAPKLATQEEFLTMLNQPGVTKSGLVGDLLADKAVGMMASLAGTAVRRAPFTKTERAKKLAAMIEAIPETGERDLAKWIGGKVEVKDIDGTIVTYLKESVQGFLDLAGLSDGLTVNGRRELDMAQTTFIAQTKVVPKLLSKILSQVTAIRTGDVDTRELDFDYNTERFRFTRQDVNPLERMHAHFGRDAMNEAAAAASEDLTSEADLHSADISALQYALAASAMSSALGVSEQGTLHEFLAGEDFMALEADTRERLSAVLNDNANDFHHHYGAVASETRVPDRTIEALIGGGFHGPLLDAGILVESGEPGETTLQIDPVRYRAWLNEDGLIEAANAINPTDVTDLVGPLPEGTLTQLNENDRVVIVPPSHNAHNGGRGPADGSGTSPILDENGNIIGSMMHNVPGTRNSGSSNNTRTNTNGSRGGIQNYASATGHISAPAIVDAAGNVMGYIDAPNAGITGNRSTSGGAIRGRGAGGIGPSDGHNVTMITDDNGNNIGFIGGSSTARNGSGFVGPLPNHSGTGGANFMGPAGPSANPGVIRDPRTRRRIRRMMFGVDDLNPLHRADIEDILIRPGRLTNDNIDDIYKILNRNRGITAARIDTFRKIARGTVSEEEIDKLMGHTEMGKMRESIYNSGAEKMGYTRGEDLTDEEADIERNKFVRNAILQKLAFTGIDKWIEEGGNPKQALAAYGFKPTGFDSKVLVGQVRQDGKKVLEKMKNIYKAVKAPVVELTSRDLYDPDAMVSPIIQHSLIGKGVYFNSEGKELKSTMDLDPEGVFDKHGNMVVTSEQIANGLVTMDGKPIKGIKGAYNRFQRFLRRGMISPLAIIEKGATKAGKRIQKKYTKALDKAKDEFMDKVPEKYRERMAKAVDGVSNSASLATLRRKLEEVVTYENFDKAVNSINRDNFNEAIEGINKENYERLKGKFSKENLEELTDKARDKLTEVLSKENKAKLASAMHLKDIEAIGKKAGSSEVARGLALFKKARTMDDAKAAMSVIRLGIDAEKVKEVLGARDDHVGETDAERSVREEKEFVKDEADKTWKEKWDERERKRKEKRELREARAQAADEKEIEEEEKKAEEVKAERKKVEDELRDAKDENSKNVGENILTKLNRLYMTMRGVDEEANELALLHHKRIEDAHTEALREDAEKKEKQEKKEEEEKEEKIVKRDERLKEERREEAIVAEEHAEKLLEQQLKDLTEAALLKDMVDGDQEDALVMNHEESIGYEKRKKEAILHREAEEDDQHNDLIKVAREQRSEDQEREETRIREATRHDKEAEAEIREAIYQHKKKEAREDKRSGVLDRILKRTRLVKRRRQVDMEPDDLDQHIAMANLETNRETLKETKEIRTDNERSRMFKTLLGIGSTLLHIGGFVGSIAKGLGLGLGALALKHFSGRIFGTNKKKAEAKKKAKKEKKRKARARANSARGTTGANRTTTPRPTGNSKIDKVKGALGKATRAVWNATKSAGAKIGLKTAARVVGSAAVKIVGGVISGPVGWALLAAEGIYWTRKAIYAGADYVGLGDHVYEVKPSDTIVEAMNEWDRMRVGGGTEEKIKSSMDSIMGFDLSKIIRGKPTKWDIYRYIQYGALSDGEQKAIDKWETSLLQSGFFTIKGTGRDGRTIIGTDMTKLNIPNLKETFGYTHETGARMVRWFEHRYLPIAKSFLSSIHTRTGQMEFKKYNYVNPHVQKQILMDTQWEPHYDGARSNPFFTGGPWLEHASDICERAYAHLLSQIHENTTYSNLTSVTVQTKGRNKVNHGAKDAMTNAVKRARAKGRSNDYVDMAPVVGPMPKRVEGDSSNRSGNGYSPAPYVRPAPIGKGRSRNNARNVGMVPVITGDAPSDSDSRRYSKLHNENMKRAHDTKKMPVYNVKSKDVKKISGGRLSNWKDMIAYIDHAAKLTGVDKHILRSMSFKESGLDPWIRTARRRLSDGTYVLPKRNKGSRRQTATGLFQVLDKTWNRSMKLWGRKYGIRGRNKTDPEANAIIGANLIKADMNQLLRAKGTKKLTPGDAYSILFLGTIDALKLAAKVKKNPNGDGRSGFSPDIPLRNKPIFYKRNGRPRTNRGVMGELERRMNKANGLKWLHKEYDTKIHTTTTAKGSKYPQFTATGQVTAYYRNKLMLEKNTKAFKKKKANRRKFGLKTRNPYYNKPRMAGETSMDLIPEDEPVKEGGGIMDTPTSPSSGGGQYSIPDIPDVAGDTSKSGGDKEEYAKSKGRKFDYRPNGKKFVSKRVGRQAGLARELYKSEQKNGVFPEDGTDITRSRSNIYAPASKVGSGVVKNSTSVHDRLSGGKARGKPSKKITPVRTKPVQAKVIGSKASKLVTDWDAYTGRRTKVTRVYTNSDGTIPKNQRSAVNRANRQLDLANLNARAPKKAVITPSKKSNVHSQDTEFLGQTGNYSPAITSPKSIFGPNEQLEHSPVTPILQDIATELKRQTVFAAKAIELNLTVEGVDPKKVKVTPRGRGGKVSRTSKDSFGSKANNFSKVYN